MEQIQICPRCHASSPITSFFCPNCGRKLKEPPLSTSLLKQILLYSGAVLLPPSGLFTGIKYLSHGEDGKTKAIGVILLLLTFISVAVSVWILVGLWQETTSVLNAELGGVGG